MYIYIYIYIYIQARAGEPELKGGESRGDAADPDLDLDVPGLVPVLLVGGEGEGEGEGGLGVRRSKSELRELCGPASTRARARPFRPHGRAWMRAAPRENRGRPLRAALSGRRACLPGPAASKADCAGDGPSLPDAEQGSALQGCLAAWQTWGADEDLHSPIDGACVILLIVTL